MSQEEGKNLFVTGFIDVELWNKATWRGVFFGGQEDSPPILGFAFENKGAAIRIFKGWRERFGKVDKYDELRISIIEGSLPGETEFSYGVHVGADIQNNVARAALEAGFETDIVANITRIHRMYPSPNSNYLEQFKKMYAQTGAFYLIPGYIDSKNQIEMLTEYSLGKHKIYLRHINEVDEDDIDFPAVQPRPDK